MTPLFNGWTIPVTLVGFWHRYGPVRCAHPSFKAHYHAEDTLYHYVQKQYKSDEKISDKMFCFFTTMRDFQFNFFENRLFYSISFGVGASQAKWKRNTNV
jgi:hypothetical protein